MQPVHKYAGYTTFDLTEGRVHRLAQPDGSVRVVAYFPKTWTKSEPVPLNAVNGAVVHFCQYTVTAWDEVLLATIPAP